PPAATDSGSGATTPSSPPPPLATPKHHNAHVPSSVELYWKSVTGLARRGFDDSAWNGYFDSIRRQVLTPVYVFAILGFVLGGVLAAVRRRWEVVPLMLWMVIVTLGFAIQYPAFSHRSRYPSYVTPVFLCMACFFAVWLARTIISRFNFDDVRPWYGLALAAPF